MALGDPPQERAELERRLAVIIRAVALASSEIRDLPGNYTQLRGSTTSDGLALPDNSGGWLLIGRDDGKPAAAAHALSFSRSMFLVYLKLPRDGIEATKYVESMRAYSREWPRGVIASKTRAVLHSFQWARSWRWYDAPS